MGTLPVFSDGYCEHSRHDCVLLDAWLALSLTLVATVAVFAVLYITRCGRVFLQGRSTSLEEGEADEDPAELSMVRRVLGRARSRRGQGGAKVRSLPLAVIKKDATSANITGHKNSRQHGNDFLMQTRRMSITDMASSNAPRRAPRAEPVVLSIVKPLADIVPPAAAEPPKQRLRPPPLITTDSANNPQRRSSGSLKLLSPLRTLRRISRERSGSQSRKASNTASGDNEGRLPAIDPSIGPDASFIGDLAATPSPSSMTRKITSALLTPFSPRKKLNEEQKQQLQRQKSAALFDQLSYRAKHDLAELSPDDRVENERRSSIQRRAARRVSVGASSLLHFQVGPDQAAVSVYEVKLQEVTLVKRLALGPLSEVYAAVWRETKVAVKLLMPREGVVDHLEEAVRNFRREIWVMNCLKHPNILTLIGASLTPSCYVLVMEYMTNGSLYEYLRDADNFFPHQLVLTAALDIAAGMAYVHAAGILQRDLKSKNCLLSDNLVVKVADFGLARFAKPGSAYTFVGTPFWAAPEIIRHEEYSEKADVYSFAIVLWELVERKDPYGTLNAFQVPLQVANDGLRPADFSRSAPLGLEPLMKQCWDSDPEQRPPFSEIAETLSKWLAPSADAKDDSGGSDDSRPKLENLELAAHVARETHGMAEEELNRFAESHDANEKTIPITFSPVRPLRGSATMIMNTSGSSALAWLKRKPSLNRSGSERSAASEQHEWHPSVN